MQLNTVFKHQLELAHKYYPIMLKNGYDPLHEYPSPLNSRLTQDTLREFYSYISEEIFEAYEVGKSHPEYASELSDILHFAVEFCLICGVKPEDIESYLALTSFNEFVQNPDLWDIQAQWGKAMNMLKYKKWKQSPKDTDIEKFKSQVSRAMGFLIYHICGLGLDAEKIYFHKNQVNQTRIQTGY